MRVVTINSQGERSELTYRSKKDYLEKIRSVASKKLSHVHFNKKLTIDMDGVLIFDDNAKTFVRIVAGKDAESQFNQYADLNIGAVNEGETCYCWYAPTVFGAQVAKGVSPKVNRAVGREMRLIPGAKAHIECLTKLGFDITAVTAGQQEAAEEVSRRVGIKKTIGTKFGVGEDGLYNGTITRFIGGDYKLNAVNKLICERGYYRGTHVGDSWSDVETLGGVPSSIAFNPGCSSALENAQISVVGYELLGLLPFFDKDGVYDEMLSTENLPKMVIVRDGPLNTKDSLDLLKETRFVKKTFMKVLLDDKYGDAASVDARIRASLEQKNVNYERKMDFMPLSEFDSYARKKFADYSRTDF